VNEMQRETVIARRQFFFIIDGCQTEGKLLFPRSQAAVRRV